jgi:hypothetical protein
MPHAPRLASSQKQLKSEVYDAGDGKLLFVPLETMWQFCEAALTIRRRGEEPTIPKVSRELKDKDPHTTEAREQHWRKLHGMFDWFRRWLFGKAAPSNVKVATLDQMQRCRKAWDYRGIIAELRLTDQTFYRWVRSRQFTPDPAWLKWLFGGSTPRGVFLLQENLQRLRKETRVSAILKAAGLSEENLREWEKKGLKKTVKAARRMANRRGNKREFERAYADLPTRTRDNIWAFAMAGRLVERCKRAGISTNHYHNLRSEARRCGVLADVEAFIKGAKESSVGKAFRGGLVAPRLYQVTQDIRRFQERAAKLAVQQRMSELDLPGLDNWFLDSVVPRKIGFPGLNEARATRPFVPSRGDLQQQEYDEQDARADAFIERISKNGPPEAGAAINLAKADGISLRQLLQAKGRKGLESRKGHWKDAPIFWCAPGQAPPSQPPNGEANRTPGAAGEGPQPLNSSGDKTRGRGRGRPASEDTQQLYADCAEAYSSGGKRIQQLKRLQEKVGAEAVPDIATMRLYTKRHHKSQEATKAKKP